MNKRAIFYWTAKQRLDLLTSFRERVDHYFAVAHWDRIANDWIDTDDDRGIRRRINEDMGAVEVAVQSVGLDLVVDYLDTLTGVSARVDVLKNIFSLPRLRLPHRTLLDPVDRAIGIYRSLLGPLWRGLFNPFYWLGWLLSWISEVPFRLLGSAGFDTAKIEGSLWGKLTKAAIQFVSTLLAGLGVLEKLDLLSPVISAIHKLLGV